MINEKYDPTDIALMVGIAKANGGGGGGGSTVVVTPVLTEGTTIATISVNGTSYAIKETDYSNVLILDVTNTGV